MVLEVDSEIDLFIHFHPFYIPARHLPFRVGVDFDSNERDAYTAIAAADMSNILEANGSPGGIIGFKLTYYQISC